jgi:hypothetical protein
LFLFLFCTGSVQVPFQNIGNFVLPCTVREQLPGFPFVWAHSKLIGEWQPSIHCGWRYKTIFRSFFWYLV